MNDKRAVLFIGVNEYDGVVDGLKILYTEAEAGAWARQMQIEHLRIDDPVEEFEIDEEEWEAYVESGEGDVMVFEVEIDPSRLQLASERR